MCDAIVSLSPPCQLAFSQPWHGTFIIHVHEAIYYDQYDVNLKHLNQKLITQLLKHDGPCRRHNVKWCRRTYCRDHLTVLRSVSDYFQTTTL